MVEKSTFASVLENRGFRFLWFNQILVQLGDNALNFALIIWVFKLTDSSLAVSGLILSIYLPVLLFGVFAGVFVDHYDRRKIIILVDFFLALAFIMFIFVKGSYFLILVNTFIRNSLTQFFMPAESSAIPQLVSKKHLLLANSLFSVTLYGSFMVGFSLGGPILNTFGIDAIFLGGAFLLMVASLMARNLPMLKASAPYRGNFKSMAKVTIKEVKQTLSFIRGKLPVASAIGLMSVVQVVVGVLAVIMPSYFEKVLHIHATDSSYFVIVPLGLGVITGTILIGRVFHSWPKRFLVVPAIIIGGALFVLAGILPSIAQVFQSPELPATLSHPRYFFRAPSLSSLFAIIAFLLGFCLVSIIATSQTVLQESTKEKDRGKVFAVLVVIMTAFSAVTVPIAGGLADLFGVAPVFILMGIVILVIGLLVGRPGWFFKENYLPLKLRQFLGLGHWESKVEVGCFSKTSS